MSTCRRGYVIN